MVLMAGCGSSDAKGAKLPDDLAKSRDKAMTAAKETALVFEGANADRLSNLLLSYIDETVKDSGEYADLLAILNQMATENEAVRMYILVPDDNGNFRLTLDTAEGTWLDAMEENPVYDEAYTDGLVASERSGWKDNTGSFWSAYAPIYNSEGDIYAIVCADCVADKLIDYPEWDRTSDSWNKYE